MGRFQDGLREFWKTLSSEDVKETKEYRFDGDLAMAMQVQERQEKSQENLILSMHHEDKENKENFKVNESNNINVKASKNKVNVQEIEDNRDR